MLHKTTTRPWRNAGKIDSLTRYLQATGQRQPKILEIGPGMAVRYLGRLGRFQSPFGVLGKIEIGIRAVVPLPMWAYESYETGEILDKLSQSGIAGAALSVFDCNPTVLRLVGATYGKRIDLLQRADLARYPLNCLGALAGTFDAVFATAVIKRLGSRPARLSAAKNIIALCRPNAIVTMGGSELTELGCREDAEYPGFCFTPQSARLTRVSPTPSLCDFATPAIPEQAGTSP